MKDYYEILHVPIDSSVQEIHKAFLELAKHFHPDINQDDHEQFVEIKEAYEVLTHPQERKQYDRLFDRYLSEKDCFLYEYCTVNDPSLRRQPETSNQN
ncbi:MAG TPA: hypothetical protein DHV51_02085 [Opitutae bacterium]|nr:hypothetical protein [Opitutae bacterium]